MSYGKIISRAEMEAYLQKYDGVHEDHMKRAPEIFKTNPPKDEPASFYFRKDGAKAFVFSLDVIQELLKKNEGTTHLVVHYAARLSDGTSETGQPYLENYPTIVISAVQISDSESKSFATLSDEPGVEQPVEWPLP